MRKEVTFHQSVFPAVSTFDYGNSARSDIADKLVLDLQK